MTTNLFVTSLLILQSLLSYAFPRDRLNLFDLQQPFNRTNDTGRPEYNSSASLPKVHLQSTGQANTTTPYWIDGMDRSGAGAGYAPYSNGGVLYPVYRNVQSSPFNATGNGFDDDTNALQYAIDYDINGASRAQGNTLSQRPAEVYLPGGTYLISNTINLSLFTIIVGDPNDMPVIKASANFSSDILINAAVMDHPELNFFMAIKNVVVDTTNIDKNASVTAINWPTAQACQLTNVNINMPFYSSGHTGISMQGGSATAFADVSITGGRYGVNYNNQQINMKGLSFYGCETAIYLSGGFLAVVQQASFEYCGTCIDAADGSNIASAIILDCEVSNSGVVIYFYDSSHDAGNRNNQIVIDNLDYDGSGPIAVTSSGQTVLSDLSTGEAWIWGNVDPGYYRTGMIISTSSSYALLDENGNYFTMAQPTYANATTNDIVNVKAVNGYPVAGDGMTDDSTSLNAILQQATSANQIVWVPYGIYILKSTLYVPAGTRMVGECWPAFSGVGSTFGDASNPTPVVMVGQPGESGVAQFQDVRFTVADITPGAIILQVNIAGENPGDVAFWNSHVTVGGFIDSNVDTVCGDVSPWQCKAAFALVQLSNTSSVYIENMWGWTADHSLDGGNSDVISTGRGLLAESQQGTWLTGTGFEHNTLYNYNLYSARNVMASMQQSETPYWQGPGIPNNNAPNPWQVNATFGDTDFSWCQNNSDPTCPMALAQNIDGGSNLYLYGAAFWTFFDGGVGNGCQGEYCIQNQARVTDGPQDLFWYGINTRASDVMVLDGEGDPTQYNNPGGWGGVIAGYLPFSGQNVTS